MFLRRTLCLVLLQYFVYGDSNTDPRPRIIGGKDAPEGVISWQVSLRTKYNEHFCGGTIISSRWILTSAECVRFVKLPYGDQRTRLQPNSIIAVVGTNYRSSGGDKYRINKIIIHPNYDEKLKSNDIAVISTKKAFVWSNHVRKVSLASKDTPKGSECLFTGWGYTGKNRKPAEDLQLIIVKAMNTSDCKSIFDRKKRATITENQICTSNRKGKGTCWDDNGGPLLWDGEVVGVSSIISCGSGLPDVYTKVLKYIKWIENNTKEP